MLIAWRDYIARAALTADQTFESSAPLENCQDRRLAVVARCTSAVTSLQITATLTEDATVGLLAVLAHNFAETLQFSIILKDSLGNVITTSGGGEFPDMWVPPVDSEFPRNNFRLLDQNYSGVRTIIIGFTDISGLDPAPEFGRLWAGPVWKPAGKTARRNFRVQTRDQSVVERSVGSQTYVDYRPRYRQLTCTIPKLSEAEAIGTEDGETPNLQDIGFEVGIGGEIIVIPTQSSNQAVHKLGIFGTFVEPPPVDFIPEASGRKYETTFDVMESL